MEKKNVNKIELTWHKQIIKTEKETAKLGINDAMNPASRNIM